MPNTHSDTTISSPVIFIPGTLCDERIWLPTWDKMTMEQRDYSPLQWANSLEDMLALSQDRIDSYDEQVHLVSFSMGGYIAALLALHPKNQNKIKSLSFVCYDPNGLSKEETLRRKNVLNSLKRAKNTNALSQASLSQYFTTQEVQEAQYPQTVLAMASDLGIGVMRAHMASTTPREDLSSQLSQLSTPQLWIAAQYDKIAKADAIKEHCLRSPSATFELLSNTAHMTPLTRAKDLAILLTAQLTNCN